MTEYRFKDLLQRYSSEDLRQYAKDLEIAGRSKMNREQLTEAVSSEIMKRGVLEKRMLALSDYEMDMLKKAEDSPVNALSHLSDMHKMDYLEQLELCNGDSNREHYQVPSEVKKLLEKDKDPQWKARRQKNAWLRACDAMVGYYYVSAPVKIYAQLVRVRRSIKDTDEEIQKEYLDLPQESRICVIENGWIIYGETLQDQLYLQIRKTQEHASCYIPDEEEILDVFNHDYPSNDRYVSDMRLFLRKFSGSDLSSEMLVSDMWNKIAMGGSLRDVQDSLKESGIHLNADQDLEEFVKLFMNLNNHTRMVAHRGHTPVEMMKENPLKSQEGKQVITANSTGAAKALEENRAKLESEGFMVDLESNAAAVDINGVKTKVYPEDPCPCGSGKPFRKCHGKKSA